MVGTNHSTGGLQRITRLVPPVQMRFFGFMVLVVCGGLLLLWMTHTTWDQLDRLQREHAAVKSESFYLGVTLRGSIRSLNEKLVQFGQAPDPKIRQRFVSESMDLQGWLLTNRAHLAELAKLPLLKQMTVDDFEILDRLEAQFGRYLADTTNLLQLTETPARPSFEERYAQVRSASDALLKSCDDLVKAQREDFTDFLTETQATLAKHQWLLKLTVTMVIGLAGGLAILVYRGMIAPLRIGLHQSRTIIERQEKLASLGVLASGVAHEIRNPLTALKMRLFSLKRGLPAISGNEDLAIISDEINRLERIVKDFLQFARPSDPELTRLPAVRILQEVRDLLEPQLEKSAIDLNLEEDMSVLVDADSQQIKQVLINLIQNSAENIGRNGTINLRLRRDKMELDGRVRSAVVLVVEDSGKGIPPEVESRLFDPFFSTKEGGTGLGLAIAARIVEKHDGQLLYKTKINQGTTFEVVLPEAIDHAAETVTY
jgi:signal transduction histidine kinase